MTCDAYVRIKHMRELVISAPKHIPKGPLRTTVCSRVTRSTVEAPKKKLQQLKEREREREREREVRVTLGI